MGKFSEIEPASVYRLFQYIVPKLFPIPISAIGSVRHWGSGRGSIVSNSFNLSRLRVFGASASGNLAYDPALFLRFWARDSAFQTG